jgi:hypothetical protein
MGPLISILIAALAGATFFGFVAISNTLLALPMGALLGAAIAVAVVAFPQDLDYRERRAR